MEKPNHPVRIQLLAVATVALGILGCASGPPASTPGTPTAGSPSAPAGGPTQPPPGGATTFHLVISDGPKAGTYDVTSTQEGACSNSADGYWATLYDAFGESGLTYVAASLQPNARGMGYAFDTGSEDHLNFVGVGDVTFAIDDRGSTATFTIVSESNTGTYHSDFTRVETGHAKLTVECASVLRPGS